MLVVVIVVQAILEDNNNFIMEGYGMPITANIEIRESAKKNGVKLWQVAEEIGMTDAAFSRKLRHELPDNDRTRVLNAITRLAAGSTEVA